MTDSNVEQSEDTDALLNHPVTSLRAIMLRTLEERLKLPQAYIMSLHEEPSDWVSIVKLALLVEATLTEYIVLEMGNPKLFEHISNSENAKRLKLAETLELINKADRNLLNMLAEIRNDFAHQVVNLTRPLSAYIRELPAQRQKEIAGHLLGVDGKQQLRNAGIPERNWLPDVFRSMLIDSVVLPLISMPMGHDIRERDKERAAWERATPDAKATFQVKHRGNKSLLGASDQISTLSSEDEPKPRDT